MNLCAKKVRLLENSITQSARKTCTSEDDIENIKLNVVHVRRLLIQFQSIHFAEPTPLQPPFSKNFKHISA